MEAFLLRPDFSGQEWQKIVLAYIQVFSPGDPVGLIIQVGATPSSSLTPAALQEKVLDLIRCSGYASFADVHLIENPGDLVATLRNFPVIHRLPSLDESTIIHTPSMELLKSALAGKLPPRSSVAPSDDKAQNSPATVAEPKEHRRLLTIIDYSFQPYSIGDFLFYLMGSLVAAEAAGIDKIDFCLLSDQSRPHADPIMRSRVHTENHYSHLMSFLPVVELNPRLGSLFIFDSAIKLNAFLAKAEGIYRFWPTMAAINEKKYMYYDILKMLHSYHQQHSVLPAFRYNEDLTHWVESFMHRHTHAAVPVTVNFRSNPHFHVTRNYNKNSWRTFFERCEGKVPVKFIIICAASEVDESLRDMTNVVIAKDHHSTLLQDLALIHFAAFHFGSSSGPATLPVFETRPYHNFNSEALPYVHHYGASLFQNSEGNLQFSFARELQALGVVPETPDELWHQFQKIWTSRDWPAEWSSNHRP